MNCKIYESKHLNMDTVIMENENIKISLLPKLGFKLASMIYKPIQKELFFQPTNGEYEKANYKEKFEKYDTSGCDEMLPTIDECIYPDGMYKGSVLPDHGEVWSREWNVTVNEDSVQGKIDLESLPLTFIKKISFLDDNTIDMEYTLINNNEEEIKFLWALHGLNVLDNDTEIILPSNANKIINVHQNDLLGDINKEHNFPFIEDETNNQIDLRKLRNYKDGDSFKYYIQQDLDEGKVGLNYTKDNIKFMIEYDTHQFPYLGIWINKGGFKNEYNCAIEPSNGYYDSVEIANNNNKIRTIKAKETIKWNIRLGIKL